MSRWGVAATAQQEADMAKKMTHVQSSNGASGWETRPKPLTPFLPRAASVRPKEPSDCDVPALPRGLCKTARAPPPSPLPKNTSPARAQAQMSNPARTFQILELPLRAGVAYPLGSRRGLAGDRTGVSAERALSIGPGRRPQPLTVLSPLPRFQGWLRVGGRNAAQT